MWIPTDRRRGTRRNCRLTIWVVLTFLVGAPPVPAGQAPTRGRMPAPWDPGRHIDVDQIKPGAEAYCLTDFGEGKVEKFNLVVVDVIRDFEPGRDAILVKGLDDRFARAGVTGGCSGSPVYVDDRLAGALAFGWSFSKDALYGATPIREMLEVGQSAGSESSSLTAGRSQFVHDFSEPIDLAQAERLVCARPVVRRDTTTGMTTLPCPLLVSGLPAGACEQVRAAMEPMGFAVAPGVSGSGADAAGLVPGAPLAVPMLTGDIQMMVLGTVTEVIDGKVYGFGHPYLGYGAVDMPMATAKIHTVVASVARSMKLGSLGEVVGALRFDQNAAVVGEIGAKPKMIPLTIRVDRYNDAGPRTYRCEAVGERILTPSVVRAALVGAAGYVGDFPLDHTIEYEVEIRIAGGDLIRFSNVSTSLGVAELSAELVGPIALLTDNPYKRAELESLTVDVRILPRNITSHIWSLEVASAEVKPGDTIDVEAVVESYLGGKKRYRLAVPVPANLSPGKYVLTACGAAEYERLLRKAVPGRFVAVNYPTLVTALKDVLKVRRDKLYCHLSLPPGGVALERAELPDLPATKALVLQNAKRALQAQPLPNWIERTVDTDTVIVNREVVQITAHK